MGGLNVQIEICHLCLLFSDLSLLCQLFWLPYLTYININNIGHGAQKMKMFSFTYLQIHILSTVCSGGQIVTLFKGLNHTNPAT